MSLRFGLKPMRCRILVANVYPLLRAGLRALLEQKEPYEVIAEADSENTTLELASSLQPDIIVFDMDIERVACMKLLKSLSISAPASRILMISTHKDSSFVMQCLQLGTKGYLLKSASVLELELALEALKSGGQYLSVPVVSLVVSQAVKQTREETKPIPHSKLTVRQLEILRLIARGETTRNIAQGLRLSIKTIEAHRSQIMHRLHIHDVASLVMFAVREGIVQIND